MSTSIGKRRLLLLTSLGCLIVITLTLFQISSQAYVGAAQPPEIAEEMNASLGNLKPRSVQYRPSLGNVRWDEVVLLSRVIKAEAEGEPYAGKVAVGAVILNRAQHPSFPRSLAGVIYQPHAFESVTNGRIWQVNILDADIRVAQDALNGWDPAYGSIYFWNPSKPVNRWIWTRRIVVWIGRHVFAV